MTTAIKPTTSVLHDVVRQAHDLAPSTQKVYLADLNRWITFAGADPAKWTRKRAAQFYAELLTRMKPQSANRIMASLRYAASWWAHYEENPSLDFAHVQRAKAKASQAQGALTPEDAARLLDACAGNKPADLRDFAMLVVGLETGMRVMSLIGMITSELVLGPGDARWPYPAARVPLKGKSPTWVPLSDTALLALRPWLAFLPNGFAHPVFCPVRQRIHDGTLAPAPTPKPLAKTSVRTIFDERAEIAGLPHINPHRLRHTFVTWRTAANQRPEEIAAVTHHDLLQTFGAMGGYMDLREIGGRVRNATPAWLADLVRARADSLRL